MFPKYYFFIIAPTSYLYWYNRSKFVVVEKKHWCQRLAVAIDEGFRENMKWQMHTNLFRNPYIDDVTADSLLSLVHMQQTKNLMTDLFLLIYKQQYVDNLIKDFLRDTISDYLKTDHCLNNFTKIVVHDTLRNDYVLKGLHGNLTSYLFFDSKNLEQMLGELLITIGWSDMIKGALFTTINEQAKA